MPKNNRVRKSLSFRLQPYEGTPLAEVADYLNGLDKEEATRKIGEILVMAFLPYARLEANKPTSNKLSSTFLIARDMADKHFGVMALALGLDAVYAVATPLTIAGGSLKEVSNQVEEEDSSLIEGKVTATEIGKLFG
ncbi:hypothetical protein [Calothrix sp. PCC 6303]|uniref:hypothetical protein n=1 Tax=Calothrix sp. PCC 6303 TaxID=1170562 RepID=UPI0002A00CFA|nr:hypothetical protein [Calothrix sp. PCC 6303]AFZ04517.1 hypothetical protein Cal6303_5641 [Calothrix sp. PCC 6303]